MNILFKRQQSIHPWLGRKVFSLWAKLELTEDEEHLIRKYSFESTVLEGVDKPGLFRNSLINGALAGLFAVGLYWMGALREFNIRIYPSQVTMVSAAISIAVTWLAYQLMRERIMVKDLMYGRSFRCNSVIELARREAYLEYISAYFRQVLESTKHWGGAESREVQVLSPEEAKRYILKGPML